MTHHRDPRERGDSKRTLRARASIEPEQAAAYLETLAHALRAGGVTIRSAARSVALRMGDRIELELEAGEEGRHSAVHLALRWQTPVPEERLDIVPGIAEPPAAPGPGTGAGVDGAPSPPRSANADEAPSPEATDEETPRLD